MQHHMHTQILTLTSTFHVPAGSLTVPPKCMGLEYKIGESNWDDVVASYRNYYRKGKSYMNKGKGPQWNKIPSRKPQWY